MAPNWIASVMTLSFSEFLGYLASVLVFITFYMKTLVALRCVAIASNGVFISYAYYEGLLPILILHGLLLPTNLYRMSQIRRLVSDSARLHDSGFPIAPLIPFMTEWKTHAGEVLFRKGDHARGMYYIAKGRIRIPEFGVFLGPGDILGEISLLTHERESTRSAIIEDDGVVYWLSEASVLQIFHQDPRLGFSLIRAITGRLIEDYCRLERTDPSRHQVEHLKQHGPEQQVRCDLTCLGVGLDEVAGQPRQRGVHHLSDRPRPNRSSEPRIATSPRLPRRQ